MSKDTVVGQSWFVMVYDENGTEAIAYDSQASAEAGQLCLLVAGLRLVENMKLRLSIVQELSAGPLGFAKAFQLYAEATDISFEVCQQPILSVTMADFEAALAACVDDATNAGPYDDMPPDGGMFPGGG